MPAYELFEEHDATAGAATAAAAAPPPRAPPPPPLRLECEQRAGDLLFVPNNWGHAVLNLEPSVGLAVEVVAL